MTFGDFYFKDEVTFDAATFATDFTAENRPHLKALREVFASVTPFNVDGLNKAMKEYAAKSGALMSLLVHPVRVACTGRAVGPGLYQLMEVLGKERVVGRMDRVIKN